MTIPSISKRSFSDRPLQLSPERLFPVEPQSRKIAQRLYASIKELPIISPHGHIEAAWFANNSLFNNPYSLLVESDHYLVRMLYSQGVPLESLRSGEASAMDDSRTAWRLFAEHFYLFRGTPSALWLNYVFSELFGMQQALNSKTAEYYFDQISAQLKTERFRPRALFDEFNIEFLATTEPANHPLNHHATIRDCGWSGQVVTTYRPDSVTDPEHESFQKELKLFGELTGEDIDSWEGYLNAHRKRRTFFKKMGATATDHGHPSACTADLSKKECQELYNKIRSGQADAKDTELFRAQMLTEMAGMSLEDGLVMQIHPGSHRNHNTRLFKAYGRDVGADIPERVEYTNALKPLLSRYGHEPNLTIILFTLDESNYARELAPLAGHYPALRLGPPWWFHDSPEGMLRFRRQTTETAGFYNTAGFNDDTRAFLSIPARHDVARRIDCHYLAQLVSAGQLDEDEAQELAVDLTCNLVRGSYRTQQSL